MERLLFDDVPYLKEAQQEHDQFAKVLKDNGVEVIYYEKETAKALKETSREGRVCQQYDRTQFHRI